MKLDNTRYNEEGQSIKSYSVTTIALMIKFEEAEELSIQSSGTFGFKLGYFIGNYETYLKVLFHFNNQQYLGKMSPVDQKFMDDVQKLELELFGHIETIDEINKKAYDRILELYPYEEIIKKN